MDVRTNFSLSAWLSRPVQGILSHENLTDGAAREQLLAFLLSPIAAPA
jgi:hypothetical protein